MKPPNTKIFDGPRLRLEPFDGDGSLPKQPILLDEYGRSILPVNAYLFNQRINGVVWETINRHAYILFDLAGVMHASEQSLDRLSDSWLAAWRDHLLGPVVVNGRQTGNRQIRASTFNDYLSCVLHFCEYAQRNGWVTGLIGCGQNFRIQIDYYDGKIIHPLRKRGADTGKVILPRTEVFTLIEAEIGKTRKNPLLKERDRVRSLMQRKGGLRRSEAVYIKCEQIPSAREIEILKANRSSAPIMIHIKAAKTGHTKSVPYTLRDVDEFRTFIDVVRPQLRPAPDVHEVFTSLKTRKGLVPQSTTNQFKIAAHAAAETALTLSGFAHEVVNIGATRQHMYRHRRVTNDVKFRLQNGTKPLQALLEVMADVGIKSLDTATHYLHLAYEELRLGTSADQKCAATIRDDILETSEMIRLHTRGRR